MQTQESLGTTKTRECSVKTWMSRFGVSSRKRPPQLPSLPRVLLTPGYQYITLEESSPEKISRIITIRPQREELFIWLQDDPFFIHLCDSKGHELSGILFLQKVGEVVARANLVGLQPPLWVAPEFVGPFMTLRAFQWDFKGCSGVFARYDQPLEIHIWAPGAVDWTRSWFLFDLHCETADFFTGTVYAVSSYWETRGAAIARALLRLSKEARKLRRKVARQWSPFRS